MPAQSFRITMRSGPTPGKYFLLEDTEVFLGRDLTNNIAIPDHEISRRHARFVKTPGGIQIEDQGSTNGTFVNGVRITAPQFLNPGDLITFGENIVVVFEAVMHDPDATIVASQTQIPSQPVQAAPRVAPSQPVRVPEPVAYQAPPAYNSPGLETPKKKKFPTWLLILLILGAIAACIVTLTLIFMPASWWCILTFNALPGCPI